MHGLPQPNNPTINAVIEQIRGYRLSLVDKIDQIAHSFNYDQILQLFGK
jgi:hypothetical protein